MLQHFAFFIFRILSKTQSLPYDVKGIFSRISLAFGPSPAIETIGSIDLITPFCFLKKLGKGPVFEKVFCGSKTDNPFCLRCFSENKKITIKDWAFKQLDNYGIKLKNEVEKEIFKNYFKQKDKKIELINYKIDHLSKKKLSKIFDKIRSKILVMEKERCWQTILNNRLYSKLKNITMINMSSLNDKEIEELEDIFNIYVKNGIEYNEEINKLYMTELSNMMEEGENINEIINMNPLLQNQISINDIIRKSNSILECPTQDTIII